MRYVQIASLGFVVVSFGAVAPVDSAAVAQGLESAPTAVTDILQLFHATGVNNPPHIDPLPDRTIAEESTLSFVVTASDPEAPPQKLTFRLGAGALTGASIDPANGLFTWTPTEGQGPGTNLFGVIVSDDGSPSLSVTQRFTVVVLEANRPPVIPPIADQTVNEGDFVIASVLAEDPDLPLQSLSFSLTADAPGGANVNASGLFTWTPDETQGPGTNVVVVIATDDGSSSLSATQRFTIIVREANRPPALPAIPEQSVDEGESLAFAVVATDSDLPVQQLTFSLGEGAADGAAIDPATGFFHWTPSEAQGPGSYFFGVIVTDDGSPAQNDSQGFIVVVREVNRAPQLPPIADRAVNEGESLALSIFATDADLPAQTLTFSLGSDAPSGASLSEGGFFFWTPGEAQGPGTNEITIIVVDFGTPSLNATQRFTVIVREVNHAPALVALPDQSLNEDESVSFNAQASDADLPTQNLQFSLGTGAPDGATIDRKTGAFAWTPAESQGPGTYQVAVIVADDGAPSANASQTFSVTVREVNRPPVLSPLPDLMGSPGSLLVFAVLASDVDLPAQTLLYNLGRDAPAGADISIGGLFAWTPSQAQAFTTNRMSVVVSDGFLMATQSLTVVVLGGAGSPPRLVNPRFNSNTFSVSVDTLTGRRYFLERTVVLAPSEWQTVGELQGPGGMTALTDPNATNARSSYRIRLH
jgi:hypothetical protein